MDSFIYFFETMASWQKFIWIVICLSAGLIIEGFKPLFTGGYRTWRHTKVNLVFLGTTMAINIGVGIVAVGVFDWLETSQFGLLYLIDLPVLAELIIMVVVFDLIAQYTVHYLLHRVNFLWRLHLVHHSDTHVDSTTGTRHHPIDFLVREIFALFAVVVTGAPLSYYVFYRTVTVFFTYFTHANFEIPKRLDKAISWVFISPNMHKFHHHHTTPWTDRNYGNLFSIWDRIFGTFVYGDVKSIKYGLDVTDGEKANDLAYQLSLPIRNNGKVKQK